MKKRYFLIGLFTLGLILSSCEHGNFVNQLPDDGQLPDDRQYVNDESPTVLGEQLENPYSVTNMKKAYSNLKLSNPDIPDIDIKSTHFYIRFLPKNEEEFELLKEDTSLILYDIPLDFEIKRQGVYYHDPKLPDAAITWQYCTVPIDKKLPGVFYEKLEDLYMPQEDEDENEEASGGSLRSAKSLTFSYDNLEDEALRITGNEDEPEPQNVNTSKRGVLKREKWKPAGRIRVWDDTKQAYVGVGGVIVRARRWHTTHKATTNSEGYYRCNSRFKRKANYSIKWEKHHFSIRSGNFGQAKLDGPKKKGDWNRNIKGGRSQYYATIFRAAWHYYYGDIAGIRRPPKNSPLRPQLKIAAMNKTKKGVLGRTASVLRVFGILDMIKIWTPDDESVLTYATTIHELAHASHWNMAHKHYNNTSEIVHESWAMGVEVVLTRMVYPLYTANNYYQRQDYTGIVEDMIDPVKITKSYHPSYKRYNDNVSGYTIRQIEDALKGKRSWNDWKESIKNKYDNKTEAHLDSAFIFWNSK
jgi:hypothetical protein